MGTRTERNQMLHHRSRREWARWWVGELHTKSDRPSSPPSTHAWPIPPGASNEASTLLHVVGRLKDVSNRKGENISAKEVEDELYLRPGIREVALIVPSDPGERLDVAGLQAFLGSRGLMCQKWTEQLEFVGELPRAPAGKVLKQELKKRFASA